MARNKRGQEKVYSALATSYDDRYVVKSVSVGEAKRMEAEKYSIRFCRWCGRAADSEAVRCKSTTDGQHEIVSKLVEPRRERKSTPTITLGEMYTNAGTGFPEGTSRTFGMTERQRREAVASGKLLVEEDYIERAMVKIHDWPSIVESEKFGPRSTPVVIEVQV